MTGVISKNYIASMNPFCSKLWLEFFQERLWKILLYYLLISRSPCCKKRSYHKDDVLTNYMLALLIRIAFISSGPSTLRRLSWVIWDIPRYRYRHVDIHFRVLSKSPAKFRSTNMQNIVLVLKPIFVCIVYFWRFFVTFLL